MHWYGFSDSEIDLGVGLIEELLDGARVAELGCAKGFTARDLVEYGVSKVEAVGHYRDEWEHLGSQSLQFHNSEATEWMKQQAQMGEQFGGYYVRRLVHYLSDDRLLQLFESIAATAEPGAFLYVSTWSKMPMNPPFKPGWKVHPRSPAQIMRLMERVERFCNATISTPTHHSEQVCKDPSWHHPGASTPVVVQMDWFEFLVQFTD